jgi:hypothetical protein
MGNAKSIEDVKFNSQWTTNVDNKIWVPVYSAKPPERFPDYLPIAQTVIDSLQIISKH